ncbi:uncharacterized protein LOC132580374 [Heteronotia binoei]|uniref:uncharacterized protein LOC132580374 n=1 Tax=Heteronotia binoei TaxID=13085 RepID=UPI0029317E6C|nr:uncharacterized protein LOC132580374 [Heteronotia binoei]
MTDQNSRWTSIRQILCCITDKDAATDSQEEQQQSSNASDYSDLEIIPDLPARTSLSQDVSEIMNLPRWEDREEMYKRRIHDLEQELTEVLKNQKAFSHHLCEMGCLAFSEMDPCDSISPSFVEKLKVYLERLQLERQQLEKRALWAEQTVWEIENEVSDLEKLLNSCGYRGTRHMERWVTPDGLPLSPPLPSQPFRFFYSKIHRKSPENKAAAQSPGKLVEESLSEVAPPKRSPVKEEPAMRPWRSPSKQGSTETKSCTSLVKRDIFPEHGLPQTIPHFKAGSCWPPPEHPQRSSARVSVGYCDTYVAQVHGHWDPLPESREQEGLTECAEYDTPSTASTVVMATPSVGSSLGTKISPISSVSLDISPTLKKSKMENCNVWSEKQHLATIEGNCEIKRQGEGSAIKQEECDPMGSISRKPVALASQISENLSDAQTVPQKLDSREAKTSQDLSGHATLQTEVSFPGKDSSKSFQTTDSSNQTVDLEPEQASCSLDLLQKPGKELSSLELSLKADLPSSSIETLETNKPLGEEKRMPEDAPGLNNKSDQPTPTAENTTVASPSQLKPKELLPSDLCEHLTSASIESPQPTSLIEESPSSLAVETAVEEN